MKYIFMGKVEEHSFLIDEWSLNRRVEDEKDEFYKNHPRYIIEPDPVKFPSYYYHFLNHIKDWKQFASSEDIEYKIEKHSSVRVGGLKFTVEDIEIDIDGTVKCFTGHVVEVIKPEGKITEFEAVRKEVLRLYKELNKEDEILDTNKQFDIDAKLVYPQAIKSLWQRFKDIFK